MRFAWRGGTEKMLPSIIDAVEGLSDGDRWAYMLALGERSLKEPAIKAQIEELAALPGWYPRKLALMSCFASRNTTIILSCLTDVSGALAAMACRVAARFLDDADLITAFLALPKRRLKILAKACAKRGRTAVAEGIFDSAGSEAQIILAPAVSSAFLAQRLDGGFSERLSAVDWGCIAVRHPSLICETFARLFAETEDLPHHILWSAIEAVWRMSDPTPRFALDLMRHLIARGHFHALPVSKLAERYPQEVAALVIAAPPKATFQVSLAWLRALDDETRVALAARRYGPLSADEFSKLPPHARALLYAAGSIEHMRGKEGALPPAAVLGLPEAQRQAEARLAWCAPGFAAYPSLRLPYLSMMPFEEALAEAKPFASQPDAELRALANGQIIAAARFHAEYFDEVLAYCLKRKNEQDPVRLAMMTALAGLPPSRWTAAHLPQLSALIDTALAAADCSYATLIALTRLTLSLAPFHVDFVKRELPKLTARTEGSIGDSYRTDFADRVNAKLMAELAPAILELLHVWRARDHNDRILTLLRGLGPRLSSSPQLLEFLTGVTNDKRGAVADRALTLLRKRGGPEIWANVIPALLQDDPSWVQSWAVSAFISQRRQDLLPPFLRPRIYKGRFPTGSTPVVAALHSQYFARWTERQQNVYAASLLAILKGDNRSVSDENFVFGRLVAMPGVTTEPVEALGNLGQTNTALRDKALMALGEVDGGRGAPALIAALNDDRARIAIYALRRSLLDMPPEQAIALLREAPMSKVTVAKEVLRLAGDVAGDEAYVYLQEAGAKSDLHPDVRIAWMRALWGFLDREETWSYFEKAACDGNIALARAAIRIPRDRLSALARVRFAWLLAQLLRSQAPLIRLETLRRLVDAPPMCAVPSLNAALVELLGQPLLEGEVKLTAEALLLNTPLREVAALAPVFASVKGAPQLAAIVAMLISHRHANSASVAKVSEALVDRLLAARRHIALGVRLAAHVSSPEALVTALTTASNNGLLHPGAIFEALQAAPEAVRDEPAALERGEERLRTAADGGLRRIGLALLSASASKRGWDENARAHLDVYRADGDPWVAEEAALIQPPHSTDGHEKNGHPLPGRP